MSIRTRLRAIESRRRTTSAGFSLVMDNHDGTYTLDGVSYPNRESLDRMMREEPGHSFSICHARDPDPLPPELAFSHRRQEPDS